MRLEINDLEGIKTDIVMGGAIKVGDRTIYPVIRILTLGIDGQNFFGAWISPIAIVVAEPTRDYVISLTDETIALDRLLEMVPSLKDEMKQR